MPVKKGQSSDLIYSIGQLTHIVWYMSSSSRNRDIRDTLNATKIINFLYSLRYESWMNTK